MNETNVAQDSAALSDAEVVALSDVDGMAATTYTDAGIFELEMQRIFGRAWIFVGHNSQIPNVGDYQRSRIGKHELLLVRDTRQQVRVLMNACTHRGTQLCAQANGNAARFVCPYHAWSFGLDGALSAVPGLDAYPDDVKPGAAHLALKAVARSDNYRGFIFASLASVGESLEQFLGPMTAAIDNLIDRAPNRSIQMQGGNFRVRYAGNWKLHHENANDTVHPGFVHKSSVDTARAASTTQVYVDGGQTVNMMAANGFSRREWDGIELHGFANGHSFMGGFYKSGILAQRKDDLVANEYRAILERAQGKEAAEAILGMDRFNNLVWPNLSINAQFHQIRVVHPISVNETEIQGFCFRLDGAPDAIFHRAVRFLGTLVSPASMIFSDDLEIFERVQRGLETAQLQRSNSTRGAHLDTEPESGTWWRSSCASELPLRVQSRAWRRWMCAEVSE
jgi:phenylpropionate dioxygenase-like ring-hydroxylating dioxygenase large terminal subunit